MISSEITANLHTTPCEIATKCRVKHACVVLNVCSSECSSVISILKDFFNNLTIFLVIFSFLDLVTNIKF